jgi:FtsH-binding integral membrane protein
MEQTSANIQAELVRRHRTAAMVIGAFLGLTVALVVVSYLAHQSLYRPADPSLAMALWITILIFGLGSFVLRRTKFNSMRLRDIAALRGISGLLATLQSTVVQIAFIGGAIALMGFAIMIMTNDPSHMLRAGGVAAIVLLAAYPQRSAWQRLVRAIEEESGAAAAEDDSSAKGIVA